MRNKSGRAPTGDEKFEYELINIKRKAEQYYDRYKEHMTLFEQKSPISRVKRIDAYDVYCLGKQLEQFEVYKAICEEQGNLNLLGKLPDMAFDVITAVQGASILPAIASVQPIDEERGSVYFKQIRSGTTRGSQTSGNVVVDPRSNVVTPTGYSNSAFEDVNVQATVGAQVVYAFTLPAIPVKSQSLRLSLSSNSAIEAVDVGPAPGASNTNIGRLFGNGLSGTVNYTTGAVSVEFANDPLAANQIVGSWQQNFELATDLPQIDTYFDSKPILARIYALKVTIGLMQSYGMTKRFGTSGEEEMSKDLVQEINREIGGDAVRRLRAVAAAGSTFSDTPPANVSQFEHRQTYKYRLADAESALIGQAGRGTITALIVGRGHAAVIQTLPGFKKITDGTTLGSHIYGMLDDITVIRVLEPNILGSLQGVALWKGSSPFEAPLVYAPYMPLTVTGTLPMSPNPLQSQKAAAVWAGVEAVVPSYAVRFDVT